MRPANPKVQMALPNPRTRPERGGAQAARACNAGLMNTQTVLLCGQSLLLSGVAAGLAECTRRQVARAVAWAEASHLPVEDLRKEALQTTWKEQWRQKLGYSIPN